MRSPKDGFAGLHGRPSVLGAVNLDECPPVVALGRDRALKGVTSLVNYFVSCACFVLADKRLHAVTSPFRHGLAFESLFQ
jgi:hypothetical protein